MAGRERELVSVRVSACVCACVPLVGASQRKRERERSLCWLELAVLREEVIDEPDESVCIVLGRNSGNGRAQRKPLDHILELLLCAWWGYKYIDYELSQGTANHVTF